MHNEPAIGVIGGSGLYAIESLIDTEELKIETPFGAPSDVIVGGRIAGRRVFFLPRHARGHRILPHELNHRANIYALRSLGVRWLLSVSAVGSLQAKYEPEHIVLPSQFFDRMSMRANHTFFGNGIVAHVSFGDPTSAKLRAIIAAETRALGFALHDGGTYVNMDGPAFSTRAESEFYRQCGFDIIGMTNLPEAKLAREAEIAQATIAMVTDYDCWRVEEEPVTADMVVARLMKNVERAKKIVAAVIPKIPAEADWPEHRALDAALVTDRKLWPAQTTKNLQAILERFV